MTDLGVHSSAEGGASIPGGYEAWTVGQHPAMLRGWIVRPVLFGSRVRVLPEHEGGHVVIKRERDARLIAAAPDYAAAARKMVDALGYAPDEVIAGAFGDDVLGALNDLRSAISKTTGADQ